MSGLGSFLHFKLNVRTFSFVTVSLTGHRHTTNVAKKTLNPVFQEKESTFDFPIYLSLAGRLGVLELVVWDKDMLKKDYLGETSIHLEDWFVEGSRKSFDDPENTVRALHTQNHCVINVVPPQASTVELTSTRASTSASGSIRVRIGYVKPEVVNHSMNFDEIHEELLRRSRNAQITLVSAPPVSDGYYTLDFVS